MSTRTRRSDGRPSGTTVTRDQPSAGQDHLNVTIKTSASKLREATSGRGRSAGGTIAVGGSQIAKSKPSRGTKRSYAESDSLDEEDDDDEMEDLGDDDDDDAEGDDDEEDDDMDVDADGDDDEEDADGDVDMDGPAAAPKTIKIHNPKANRSAPGRRAAAARVVDDDDEDDEEELSEIEVSDPENVGDMSINVGGQDEDDEEEDEEEDAEGEDDEMEAGQDDEDDAEGELDVTAVGEADDLDSDEDGSGARSPDLSKMTRRQRARFEDEPQSYMKLSDEVQAKKVFTAEELSMRRQEMARRRRNLSEKRNEEVKMETINKLLKKQAPKTTRKANAANDAAGNEQKPDITLVRWVSNKDGSRLAIPDEMLAGPAGNVFRGGLSSGKMVEEVK